MALGQESKLVVDLRVSGWPVAVDLLGVVLESARLRNSEEVIAL